MKRLSDWAEQWKMTPEAEQKMKEIQSGWNNKHYEDTFHHMIQPAVQKQQETLAEIIHNAVAVEAQPQAVAIQNPIHSRYFGDTHGKETPEVGQNISLEEYVEDLKEFKIVKDVYVLSDDREDDGTVSILIKLIPLMSLAPHVFDAENKHVTNYLQSTSIVYAKEIHVSFQYTEVYK